MKLNKLSQTHKVLYYLLKGNNITQRKAIAYFNIIRLSGVIYNLRHNYGIPIKMILCPNLTHNGNYGKYFIDKEYLNIITKKSQKII